MSIAMSTKGAILRPQRLPPPRAPIKGWDASSFPQRHHKPVITPNVTQIKMTSDIVGLAKIGTYTAKLSPPLAMVTAATERVAPRAPRMKSRFSESIGRRLSDQRSLSPIRIGKKPRDPIYRSGITSATKPKIMVAATMTAMPMNWPTTTSACLNLGSLKKSTSTECVINVGRDERHDGKNNNFDHDVSFGEYPLTGYVLLSSTTMSMKRTRFERLMSSLTHSTWQSWGSIQ
jgi:hypothetical protein